MFRKELIEILRQRPYSVAELAQWLEQPPRDVEQDLRHLGRSLKHTRYRLVVEPARCRHCGFAFGQDKLRKPGKCPKCRGTWIQPPRVSVDDNG